MKVMCATAACFLTATMALGAVEIGLDLAAVDAALRLGRSGSDRDLQRYHASYRHVVGKAPVDYLEIVTPFRRLVMTAETRARIGDRTFGQRQALEMVGDTAGRIDVQAEFTFHPLNNYVGVPDYAIFLQESATSGRPTAAPTGYERVPRFGARVEGAPLLLPPVPGGIAPGKSQPMLGGAVIAHFDGRGLNPTAVYDVVVEEAGKELARARVDFAKLR